MTLIIPPDRRRYDGETIIPELDNARLDSLIGRVWSFMRAGRWQTLDEIHRTCGGTVASVSARLRDFRKDRFGAHTVEMRARVAREKGLFEYRLICRTEPEQPSLFSEADYRRATQGD